MRNYLFLALFAGCASAPPIIVGNYSLEAEAWRLNEAHIRQRASFDLNCPAEQLQLTLIHCLMEPSEKENYAMQVGVTGCGHRGVYMRIPGTAEFALNSSERAAK